MWLYLEKLTKLSQELKSKLKPNIDDTLMHCPETPSTYMTIDNYVCFHRWHFADPVKPLWCITGLVEPLESTDENWWGTKLLPISVLIYPVDCNCVATSLSPILRTQHHCLYTNDRKICLWLSHPFSPLYPLPPTHPLIHNTHDITGVVKTQKSAVNAMWQNYVRSYKTALLIQKIWCGYNGAQENTVASIFQNNIYQNTKMWQFGWFLYINSVTYCVIIQIRTYIGEEYSKQVYSK